VSIFFALVVLLIVEVVDRRRKETRAKKIVNFNPVSSI